MVPSVNAGDKSHIINEGTNTAVSWDGLASCGENYIKYQHITHKATHLILERCERLPTPRCRIMSIYTSLGLCTIESGSCRTICWAQSHRWLQIVSDCTTLPPILRYQVGSNSAQVQHGYLSEDRSNILTLKVDLANKMMECQSMDVYIYESVEVLLWAWCIVKSDWPLELGMVARKAMIADEWNTLGECAGRKCMKVLVASSPWNRWFEDKFAK